MKQLQKLMFALVARWTGLSSGGDGSLAPPIVAPDSLVGRRRHALAGRDWLGEIAELALLLHAKPLGALARGVAPRSG